VSRTMLDGIESNLLQVDLRSC